MVTSLGPEGVGGDLPRPRRIPLPAYRITNRDVEVLRWITRHGVVTTDQVARHFFKRPDTGTYGIWAAYRRLHILEELELLVRERGFVGGPKVLRTSARGARLADAGLRPAKVPGHDLAHALLLVDLIEHLADLHPDGEVTTEREIRAGIYRARFGPNGRPVAGRIPDAILHLPPARAGERGRHVAIEVDRVRKDRLMMEDIIRGYDHNLDVDVVWWYVPPARQSRVQEIVRAMHAESRIDVRPLPPWLA